MDIKSLLNQALSSDIVRQGQQQLKSSSTSSTLKSLGAGAVGGGLVNLLMGSKKSKKMGKKVGKNALKVGGAAALGALAYKVYNDWQASQTSPATPSNDTFNAQNSIHEQLILKAMIAAAKADGHVDETEMKHIETAIAQAGADEQLKTLIHQELNKPLDPSQVAQLATTPQQASEVYLASLIIIDEQNFMEKAYLQELAKQLNLAPEVTQQLEMQLNH
ncbi:tellurite resistance TerB family protein [Vibrio sp. 404]|uniref:Tellurite resistance TerB family protein n=1 Tax=Vibrio marinisediminis TaxID=2758441 RepID=A0A7W2FSU1_9VIBR|nr:tellurite resistance TerB family protein [Vibrio marinisediminis]MBA5763623.1 tellurite resistance TerB family protein [Vibrio marinisediminis]